MGYSRLEKRRESDLEALFVRACEAQGWGVRKLAYPGRRGAPDRMVLLPCEIVMFAELKRGAEGVVSSPQDEEHRFLAAYGHQVMVVRDIGDVEMFIRTGARKLRRRAAGA